MADRQSPSRIEVARVRRARLLAPVDTVRPVDGPSIPLLAALHDLLQATNHELSGPLTRGRHARLAPSVVATCERGPASARLGEALSRHATFARALEVSAHRRQGLVVDGLGALSRTTPFRRASRLARGFRRVHIEENEVPIMASATTGLSALPPDSYLAALGALLTRSPAHRHRDRGAERAEVQLVGLDALARFDGAWTSARLSRDDAASAGSRDRGRLARAREEVRRTFDHRRHLAESFASEVAAGQKIGTRRRAEGALISAESVWAGDTPRGRRLASSREADALEIDSA